MSDTIVPVIDIGPFLAGDPAARQSVPQAVAGACEEIGFFTIVGHGIDSKLIGAATGAARQFFDLPLAEKMRARSADANISRGYRGIGNEGLAGTRADETPPDLKEVFTSGRRTSRMMRITARQRRNRISSTTCGRNRPPTFEGR
jgi:isopenicillin N synthase-like dioxygenase